MLLFLKYFQLLLFNIGKDVFNGFLYILSYNNYNSTFILVENIHFPVNQIALSKT
jgi:hypothetical protein